MAGAERWLAMQAQSHSRYPRASHDSYHVQRDGREQDSAISETERFKEKSGSEW